MKERCWKRPKVQTSKLRTGGSGSAHFDFGFVWKSIVFSLVCFLLDSPYVGVQVGTGSPFVLDGADSFRPHAPIQHQGRTHFVEKSRSAQIGSFWAVSTRLPVVVDELRRAEPALRQLFGNQVEDFVANQVYPVVQIPESFHHFSRPPCHAMPS